MKASVTRPAFALFFPLAALLATLAIPLSIWVGLSETSWLPGLRSSGHGYELLFGFALALVAGYTLGTQPERTLYALAALWLAARISHLFFPSNIFALLLPAAFAGYLAWLVVPRFKAAKQWRNKITGPLILSICLIPSAWLLLSLGWRFYPDLLSSTGLDNRRLLHTGVVGLLLLMSFIGGRLIAPGAATTLAKQGIELKARLQPRIEAALIIVLGLAILPLPFPWLCDAVAYRCSAVGLLIGAGLLAVRVSRWQLWNCTTRPDLLAFGLGYVWLAGGSLATGLAFFQLQSPGAALHLITIGGLGTLSTAVILRLYCQRSFKTPPSTAWVWSTSGLIAAATLLRFASGNQPFAAPVFLSLSALCWSLAYLALVIYMLRLHRQLWPHKTS